MADIFISYAREDRALATRIATFLIARGISVWLDRELTAGERFSAVVQDALAQARAVVVLWSSHSVKSHWVNAEATEALKHDKLIPLLLDDSEPPLEFKNVHTLFVGAWLANANDAAGADLIRAIGKRTQLGTTVSTGASAAPIVSELRSRLQAVDTLRDLREGLHQAESYLAQNPQDTTARLLLHDYKEAIDSRTGTRVPQRSLTRLGVQKWLVASISVVLVAVLAVVIGIRVLKGTSPHNALSLAPAVSVSKTASSLIPDTEKAFFFDDFSGG